MGENKVDSEIELSKPMPRPFQQTRTSAFDNPDWSRV